MNKQLKVFIADSDIIVRRALTTVLLQDPDISVLGITEDYEGLEDAIRATNPDLLLMGIGRKLERELKVMVSVRIKFPLMPVVVVSELSHTGGAAALYALKYGAADYVTKPISQNNILFAERHFNKRLIPIIKYLTGPASQRITEDELKTDSDQAVFDPLKGIPEDPVRLVLFGGCTGGVRSLMALIPKLPADFNAPVVIAQHMPKIYTDLFARYLDERSAVSVREGFTGARLKPGTVWIAPGGYQTEIRWLNNHRTLITHRGPRENRCRPSIDVMFRSAAEQLDKNVLAVLLPGGGDDGVAGTEKIYRSGGRAIVQQEPAMPSQGYSMTVLEAGLAYGAYSLKQIDQLLKHWVPGSFRKQDTRPRWTPPNMQKRIFNDFDSQNQ